MHAYTAYVSVGDSLTLLFLYRLPMGKLLVLGRRQKLRPRFLVHAFIACVSVEKTLKSQFLYGLPMSKLLVISRGPKWQPKLSRTCLYNVCERGKDLEIAIFVWASYEQVVGSQSRTKMAAEIFPCMAIQRM